MIIYAHDVTWTSTRPDRKENVEFQEEPFQFFVNEKVLHNRSENHYHNYIRRLFTSD